MSCSGLKLWQRAKQAIPGGNGLLSKRPDRYAPDIWPAYFSRAKGCEIWDLDGNRYVDMAQMGIGTAILGYSDEDVNAAVTEAIEKGVNATLNAPEEVYLAEKLLALNPFAGGVRFTRTGGEAMAMAVRIARAYSGRDRVAFSGYHGWCDWYIATNLSAGTNLDNHLLPGLLPKGIPRGLCGSALPFRYNDPAALRQLLDANDDVGVIVIEGARYDFPTPEFLEVIRQEARRRNIVVVVDEITSGWRMTDGGVYKLNGFQPDIVVYGKAMGNGFAISAVVGKKEIMAAAQETFISSTFWTERVGFTAALATIQKLMAHAVWEQLIATGTMIGAEWQRLARKHSLDLQVTDFKPLISMKFGYGEKNPAVVTLFIQEMLKRGYLAAASVYVSYAHSTAVLEPYFESVDAVFQMIAAVVDGDAIFEKLETQVLDEGFKRLT